MDDRALIQYQLALTHRYVGRCVGDLSDADAVRRPGGLLAPAVWHVGHLALADLKFLEVAGVAPAIAVPDGYAALFRPGAGGEAEYPVLAEVTETFSGTHDALARAVAEADLDRALDNSPGTFATAAEMFSFTAAHRWYHIGKITSLRAFLGKPRLFG
jgi:DinB superfamily